ncbi:MAG TPA: UDP-N-acetylmuramoyl-tripeptide--D-alanyl-D-alanine ligase [Chitinophagaceae bacterium]|nr:UDP-N-acetylmuramoyl-tripeptide--D-alanyl-D-alanine ligase [Chitinophagaceae bacterium]
MTIPELYTLYREHPSVQTDTRKLKAGDIFFALRGPHFNGNSYAGTALDSGASYAVIDDPAFALTDRTILVLNVLETLQQLAAHHRKQLSIPVLAITGSNGKTTTKELIKAVLSASWKTYSTEGNLNNHIGVPLSLLKITAETQIAVLEMGASHLHEIEGYCRIARPTHGLITNCGKAHLEGFGSLEAIRQGKGELFDYLRATAGTAFVCQDLDYLQEMSRGIKEICWYGTSGHPFVQGHILESVPLLIAGTDYTGSIRTRMFGSFNLFNVLAAVAVGKYFQVSPAQIKSAIEGYSPVNQRSQLINQGSNTIILDAYNANPTSMKLAIEDFSRLPSPKKILILGAMMELGPSSLKEHGDLVQMIGDHQWENVVLAGGDFEGLNHPYIYLPDAAAVRLWLEKQHLENTYILVKGSRGMAMEKVLE